MAATKSPKKSVPPAQNGQPQHEVFTLTEAAAYLRLAADEVLRLVQESGLPGKQCGADWRFSRQAIQHWLSTPQQVPNNERLWQEQFGALQDDPYLAEMLADIYKRRGRPEAGDR